MTSYWGDDSGRDMRYFTAEDGDIVLEYEGELEPEQDDSFPSAINLGGGFTLVIPRDLFRQIMHSPYVTALVEQRCQEICDAANSMAVEEGAEYIYFVSNNSANVRGRGRVKTGNAAARRDNAIHSTLFKALASVGSDPHPVLGDTQGLGMGEGEPIFLPAESAEVYDEAPVGESAGDEFEDIE